MAKRTRKTGRAFTTAKTKRVPAKKAAARKRPPRKRAPSQRASVRVGLHGLGKILRVIHGAPGDLQRHFEDKIGTASVLIDAETAIAIKTFVFDRLKGHPILDEMAPGCDCDPVADPYCICF